MWLSASLEEWNPTPWEQQIHFQDAQETMRRKQGLSCITEMFFSHVASSAPQIPVPH